MANNEVKCACKDCTCSVPADRAVQRDGQVFCCEACANGHKDHAGCEHQGCSCHG